MKHVLNEHVGYFYNFLYRLYAKCKYVKDIIILLRIFISS